jgi:hypothetical protein
MDALELLSIAKQYTRLQEEEKDNTRKESENENG